MVKMYASIKDILWENEKNLIYEGALLVLYYICNYGLSLYGLVLE